MLKLFKQYYPIRNIFFVIGEGLIIFTSVFFSAVIVLDSELIIYNKSLLLRSFLITIILQASLYYNDLYDLGVSNKLREISIRLLQSIGAATIMIALIYFVFPKVIIRDEAFYLGVAFIILFIVFWRFFYARILNNGMFNKKIILLGSGGVAQEIMDEVCDRKDCGYSVSIVVPEYDNHTPSSSSIPDTVKTKILLKNGYEGLCELADELKINKIIVALREKRGAFPVQELLRCRVNGIDILEGNTFYEMLTGKLIVKQINPAWLIFSEGFRKSFIRRFVKRAGDLFLSVIMAVLLLPVVLIVAVMIKIDSKGPVLFSQERVGEKGEIFNIHKFRSMRADAEKLSGPTWAESEDPRITRVGRFIRKLRLDEIPQLWDVICGKMSFVGPRPERQFFVNKLEKSIPYFRERLQVKPGITGWAQINYGYGASVDDAVEKLNYDLFYIKNMSICMDLMIILRTIKTVIFGMGR